MKTKKVIFLDIDGVLLTMDTFARGIPDSDPIAYLNWLTETTGAVIVLSSSWRIGKTHEDLQILFDNWGILGILHSVTPDLISTRGREIDAWIEVYGSPKSMIILDDEDDFEPWQLPSLIRTTMEDGLDIGVASVAKAHLGMK